MAYKHKDRVNAIEKLAVRPKGKVSMDDFDPGYTWKGVKKENAKQLLSDGVLRLAALQDKFYAQDTYSLLIVLQAMDAAGKDGTIRHVMFEGLDLQYPKVGKKKKQELLAARALLEAEKD